MFKFWTKKQVDTELAKIELSIKELGEKPKLDIQLLSYDDASLKSLCDILEVFQGDRFLVEVLNFIQTHFLKIGKDEELIKIFVLLQEKSLLKVENPGPCIKPSEMMT